MSDFEKREGKETGQSIILFALPLGYERGKREDDTVT